MRKQSLFLHPLEPDTTWRGRAEKPQGERGRGPGTSGRRSEEQKEARPPADKSVELPPCGPPVLPWPERGGREPCRQLPTVARLSPPPGKKAAGNSLAVQWLEFHALTAEGPGLIPSQGTKIPQARQPGQMWLAERWSLLPLERKGGQSRGDDRDKWGHREAM